MKYLLHFEISTKVSHTSEANILINGRTRLHLNLNIRQLDVQWKCIKCLYFIYLVDVSFHLILGKLQKIFSKDNVK